QIQGQVKIDPVSRLLYSTDASIYQIEPLGVAFPKSAEDLQAIVQFAAKNQIPLLPRGAGSSLAGQAVGRALVLDCSRYLDKISLNPEDKTARVEPGVVFADLNARANKHGLQFGPDPASGERATIGGMIGNNATGAHSIRHGMTGDHLLQMDVFLADGTAAAFEPVSLNQAWVKAEGKDLEAMLYQRALQIREQYADAIKQRWPRTWRNVSGYALNYLLPWSASSPPAWEHGIYPSIKPGEINLAPLMAGSEGTLALFSSATLRLVETPKHKVLLVLAFDSLIAAVTAAPDLLEHGPSAIELVPRAIIDRARRVPAYASRIDFLEGSPEALLLVEFAGDDPARLAAQAKSIGTAGLLLENPQQQEHLWEVRKVGLGLLMSVAGDAKPIPFVEDVAVPVDHLAEFVGEFQRILTDHDTQGDFYAHASAGCLHIRPWVNLKSRDGIEMMKSIAGELVSQAIKHEGTISGEHGNGIARSGWLEQIYGAELLGAFGMLKQAADPHHLLNPGKVIDPPPMEANLRLGEDYQTTVWPSLMDFSDQEGIAGAIEMCNGAGVCRKMDPGMCPTFQATRDEMHATRGRANLLRAMISGRHPDDLQAEEAVFEALGLCLACKACKAECPSGVDMARLKYAFLDQYYRGKARPLRDYLFGYIGELARIARIFRVIINPLLSSGVGKIFLAALGISKERYFPEIAGARQAPQADAGEAVVLISDPYTEYFTPELELHARHVLTRAGCRVIKLKQIGTGRTKLSKGMLNPAKREAAKLLRELKRIDPEGNIPVVGIEPSEVATLTDDLLSLVPGDVYVEALSGRAYSIEEYLLRNGERGEPRCEGLEISPHPTAILIHGHCYQKAQRPADDGLPSGVDASVALFESLGCSVEVIDSGCCGMAGAFGYETVHYETSMLVGELALFPAVREKREEQVLVAPGASCRTQIEGGTGEEALHPVTLLNQLMTGE
ncbi:MAG: FAD-linked oxidase C-terminal domain-containing protein, partial [Chloroflexota bacterium]